MPRSRPASAPPRRPLPSPDRRRAVAAGALVFFLALFLRLLFWQATPDRVWPYSALYKGDAVVWLGYARALAAGVPFELGLPLRPPAMAWLVAALWGGAEAGFGLLRFAWCALGAVAATLFFAAAHAGFGLRVGLVVGLWSAASTGLMVLSASLNNETPYLVVVALSLLLWPTLRRAPASATARRLGAATAWGALGAAGCLLRVEHALFVAAATVLLAAAWLRPPAERRRALAALATAVATGLILLAPWHLDAWRRVGAFNRLEPTGGAAAQAQAAVERALAGITWSAGAAAERERLPAFVRRSAANFVAATVLVRGRRRVEPDDPRAILEQAFGSWPEPVPAHPFVALYGPLNFHLANHAGADGGFSRGPLERPPPLAGGPWPAPLVAGLPPAELALSYPPHLEVVNHGYRLGWEWIRANPGDFVVLAGRKLAIFWGGAARGVTGLGLPIGGGGLRRPVDLAVPTGAWPAAWRWFVLALSVAGLAAAWRRPEAWPWVIYLGSKVVVTVAFFGYARQGALVVPAVALLASLAARRWPRRARVRRAPALVLAAAVAALLLGAELVRFAGTPAITVDGEALGRLDPHPREEHRERRVEVD